MKDFFELTEGLVKVTDVEFDYRDQLPNSPKTSDIGAISSEWKQDRTALRDAVKKMGGLVTNTVAPSRGNKWVGTVTIGTRDDPSKLDDKSIQKAVKSHGIEIHSNQFRESTDLEEVKVKDFFELRESAISKRYGKKDGKPVKESVELDEATAKIKTTMADKVSSGATRFGLKAKSQGGHVSISGPKGKLNDFLRAIIGRSSYGNASDITEGTIVEGTKVSKSDFDKLKKGSIIDIDWDGAMSAGAGAFKVVSKTRSAKYNVDKVKLAPTNGGRSVPFYLYSRKGGDATLAIGDMGATMTKYKIVKESVELDEAKLSDMEIHNKLADRNLLTKAIKTAEKMGGNMTGAVREIEKMKKGLSKHKAVQAALQQANESVELDEAADFMKMSKELLKHKDKGIEYEKAAAYVRAIHNNSNVNVQDKAFMGLTKMLKDMDDFTKKTTITKILKDNGFKVKGGKLMREEVELLDENYRTLATKGMGAETKNSINVGRDVDYYDSRGDKRMGKVTKMTKTGYVVKDEKDGKSHTFAFHDRAKAKELLAK